MSRALTRVARKLSTAQAMLESLDGQLPEAAAGEVELAVAAVGDALSAVDRERGVGPTARERREAADRRADT